MTEKYLPPCSVKTLSWNTGMGGCETTSPHSVRENQRKIDILAFHREISFAVIELGLICAFLNNSRIQRTLILILHFPSEANGTLYGDFPISFASTVTILCFTNSVPWKTILPFTRFLLFPAVEF